MVTSRSLAVDSCPSGRLDVAWQFHTLGSGCGMPVGRANDRVEIPWQFPTLESRRGVPISRARVAAERRWVPGESQPSDGRVAVGTRVSSLPGAAGIGSAPAISYRFFVRNSWRCAVQGDAPRSPGAQLPCQPQTQVIVWSRWTYVSMTCLNGTSSVRAGGRSGELDRSAEPGRSDEPVRDGSELSGEAGGRPFTRGISWDIPLGPAGRQL